MPDTVAETVIAVIAKTKKVPPETVSMDSSLEELRIDSLDGLNMFFELEEALDVTIPDDKAKTMRSVRQIVEELEKLVSSQRAKGSGAPV